MTNFSKWLMRGSFLAFGIVALMYVFTASKKSMTQTDGSKEAVILHTVMQALEQAHFRPQEVNDNFSKAVYKSYLEDLDGAKRFFTAADINQFKPFESRIDDDIKVRNLEFYYLSLKVYKNALLKSEAFYKEAIAKPYDPKSKETIELNPDKIPYAKNDAELKQYWAKIIQFDIANRYLDKLETQEKTGNKADQQNLLKDAQIKVKETYDEYFIRLKKISDKSWFEAYLNAITSYFDPHSNYFSPRDKENFDMQMSGKYEGIGARLGQEKEFVRITDIIPGGPAAKNKQLEVDDLILRVSQDGGASVDVIGYSVEDAITHIRGKKGTGVTLNVKKKDGTTKDIHLIRDEVILEEGWAKSSILEIPGSTDKIGFISLPSFYADFEDNNGKSCARDVATEIAKCQAKGVKGIIIDLRYNGGGSLSEVVEMAGQFIETGPVVQVKSKSGSPYVMNDRNNAVGYDGPIVVMTNAYSASASEILAAALQDYKRAVIVGSPSSFGKGTVQRFYPLDKMVNGLQEYKPLGEIKITMQNFYRINGGSTQLKGVEPDIVLADNFKYIKVGEKEYEHPLEWTQINKVNYNQNVYVVDNLEDLKTKSKMRTDTNKIFKLFDENAMRLKKREDETIASLNFEEFRKSEKSRDMEADKFASMNKRTTRLVPSPSADFSSMDKSNTSESVLKERQEEWFRNIRKDVYIEECALILQDMIQSTNKGKVAKKN